MVIWIIGLSGAGKTTLANTIIKKISKHKSNVVLLDGDIIRDVFGNDLSHSIDDRLINAQRINRLCKMLDDQNIHVVCSILSLFQESRNWNRQNIKNYFEVYIDAPMDQLQKRDYKGIYKQYNEGKIKDVAGIDIEFIPPENPDLIINNHGSIDSLLIHASFLSNLLKESNF